MIGVKALEMNTNYLSYGQPFVVSLEDISDIMDCRTIAML